jgi:predicted metal-binding membrane protein
VSVPVARILHHERWLVGVALATLTALAWAYVYAGAGTGMPASTMTALALFPHLRPDPMAGMAMPMPFGWLAAVAMWWVMMVAMMTPSVAPLVLLYGRVLEHHRGEAASRRLAPSIYVVAGYLAGWLAFSIVAATIQMLVQRAGFLSSTMLWSSSAPFSAAVLAAAGLYQLSPLKSACLANCRGPVEFLTRHWRPGCAGAFAMGVRHGTYCVGCCWMLMALLFVGGVMNLAWIAALATLVLVEKLTPAGPIVSRASGVVLLAWAAATVLV